MSNENNEKKEDPTDNDTWFNVSLQTVAPVIQTFRQAAKFFDKSKGNKYGLYTLMYQSDPKLYGDVRGFAAIVTQMYAGIKVESGEELDDNEKRMLTAAKEIEEENKFSQFFYNVAEQLIINGDCIALNIGLKILPMEYMTILEKRNQIDQADAQVFYDNLFVMNEGKGKGVQKVFTKNQAMHFSLNNNGKTVYDTRGRYTHGVYSVSPFEPLVPDVYWKRQIKVQDILWRTRNVPREHHKLDLSGITLDKFSGDVAERHSKAKAMTVAELQTYANSIKDKQPDEGWVTTKTVEIGYVEPKSPSHTDPNELINQIDSSISNATRYPHSPGGNQKSSYASEFIISGTLSVEARHAAKAIAAELTKWLRKKLESEFSPDMVKKIKIRLQLVLNYEKTQHARMIAVLASTNLFHRNELREEWGADPVEDNEFIGSGKHAQSPGQIGVDRGEVEGGDRPQTPTSSEQQSQT